MDFTTLNTFIAVAESASFSLAAERLHLTQPAVSKRISALESGLDQRLFDRIGHRIQLTEAGHTLLPRAQRMLAELADARREMANLSGRVAGPLRIATSHHIGLHRLAPVLAHYHRAYPEVELDIVFLASEGACAQVQQGNLELAIVTLPPVPTNRLCCMPIWIDDLRCVASHSHPLANDPTPTPASVVAHPAILPEPETFTRTLIDTAFSVHSVHPYAVMQTNYLETIKMLVGVGLGWSLLPANMLDETLHEIPLTGLVARRNLGVVTHSRRTPSNAANALISLLQVEEP